MIGKVISHYRILEKLGEGGMGVVYKAEDTRLKRIVALKFLPPQLTTDAAAKERFIQEAQAASALEHPNICNIHEINETGDGQLYIVMACYEGLTLKERLASGPLPISLAIDYARQMAAGLAEAHEKGIIHRDLKPANIMITEKSQVKIMDFGLAKLARQAHLTQSGSTLGTAAYMSPEQARGDEVDARSDVWSLGVVIYEMVIGQRPFKSEYAQALIYAILNDAPTPVKTLNTDVPAALERAIDCCLQKERSKRYRDAGQLLQALQPIQQEEVCKIEHCKSSGKKKTHLLVGAGLLILVMTLLAYFFLASRKAPVSEKSIAVLPFVDMSPQKDQDYFCDGMTEELINRLSNLQGLRVPARTSAFVFKGKTEDIKEIGRQLNVTAVVEGSVRKSDDELRITAQLINVANGYHLWSETYDRRLNDVFAIQDEISTAIIAALQLKLTPQETQKISEHPINNVKAYECYLRARRHILRFDAKSLDSASVYLQTAMELMGENAELYAGMAAVYSQYANIGIQQEDYLEKSRRYAEKALELQPNLSSALAELATLSTYEEFPENLQKGFKYSHRALAANPTERRALHGMAMLYEQIGQATKALPFVERMEHNDPLNPLCFVMRGFYHLYNCEFERAVRPFQRLYESDPTSPLSQTSYANALAMVGRRDEALAVIAQVRDDHPTNVMVIFSLLLKCALEHDSSGALRLITPDFRKTCWRDFEWSCWVANWLASAGAKEQALNWLENAIRLGFINHRFLQQDSFFDPLRQDERFKTLIAWAKEQSEHFEVPE